MQEINAYLLSYGEEVAKKVAEKTRAEEKNNFILNLLKMNKLTIEDIAAATNTTVDHVNRVAAQGV